VQVVLLVLSTGALVAGCASASPGGATTADLAIASGPGPVDLALPPHDFAPHDLAGSGVDLLPPPDLGGPDLGGAPPVASDDPPVTCSSCTVTLVGGTIAAFKPDGGSWDPGGGLADAYVNMQLLSGGSKRSSTKSDVTTVTWNETMFTGLSPAQLLAGFTLTVMDEDPLNPDDTVASWTVSPTAAQLATGSITLTSGSGPGMVTTITLSIN
jgi:hypothetical protein